MCEFVNKIFVFIYLDIINLIIINFKKKMNKLAKIENSWYEVLKEEFDKQYFLDINTKINDDIKA
ncbi:MAG: hypothetical protein Q8S84_04970 [bacterium]|nr:hypothetical protein [bacterium]MDP3380849.1 hypothetical protein [bacterium]